MRYLVIRQYTCKLERSLIAVNSVVFDQVSARLIDSQTVIIPSDGIAREGI